MLSWTSIADRIFKREGCERLIKNQDRSFEFKGVGVEIPGFKFSFEGFSTEPKVLQEATEAAKALDYLQYQLCQNLSKKSVTDLLDRDVLTRYAKARISSLFLFSSFRVALEAFKNDQEGQRVNLEKSIKDIRKFTSSLTIEDLAVPEGLSPKGRDAISSALKAAKVEEQELDQVLLDKFAEFEKTQKEILERVKQVQESFETQLTELKLSGANVELVTALKQYNKGDPNCWKDAYFEDADIRNGYDARRPVTDDIIRSIETHAGTFVYGDPYVGKSILVKRVMFEMADKGYAVIYSSRAAAESNAYQIKDLLTSLSNTYPKILFVADDAHKATNESFLKVFNELYDTTGEKSMRFLFAARERQLEKLNPVIERALRKISKDAQFQVGFGLDDAIIFLRQAFKVTYGQESARTTRIIPIIGKLFYEISQGDPFMFSLSIRGILLAIEYSREGRLPENLVSKEMRALIMKIENLAIEYSREGRLPENLVSKEMRALIMKIENLAIEYSREGRLPENLVSKEMRALIMKIEKIKKEERAQNNEIWKATIISAVMGLANITFDRKGDPRLFTCSKILPVTFRSLLENNILLKESDDGELRIRHESLACEFLSVLYEDRNYFNNNPELFNEHYASVVKCVWNNIEVDEIIDLLNTCSYLYSVERYKPMVELVTDSYLIPLDQYSPPSGIHDSDKAKLFCYGLGNFYARRKEYEKSLSFYDKALKINPNYVDAWSNKGLAFSNSGRDEEAIKCYDKSLELNPNQHNAWSNKGTALYNLGMYEEAIVCYDKAIEISPAEEVTWFSKGAALCALDKYDEAIICCDKAIEIEPNYISAWSNKGISLYALDKYGEAIEHLDKSLELNPNQPNAYYVKGLTLSELGNPQEAIACYDKAIEINPDDSNAWYNRACSKVKKGDAESGLTDLKKAIEIDEQNIELAKQEKDFESIRNDKRFKTLVREDQKL